MSWPAALLAMLVSHAVGDVLLQTDWQATHKVRGFEDLVARHALFRHVAIYTLAFVPAVIWIGEESTLARALGAAALVAISHLLVDDGRLVRAWLRVVKRTPDPGPGLLIAVDQSFHLLCLFAAALVAAA